MDTPTLAVPGLPPTVSSFRRKARPAPNIVIGSGPLPSTDAVPTPSIRFKQVCKVSEPLSQNFTFGWREISGGESVTQVDVAVVMDSCTTWYTQDWLALFILFAHLVLCKVFPSNHWMEGSGETMSN